MTLQLDMTHPYGFDPAARERCLWVTAVDGRAARHAMRVVEDVRGEPPEVTGDGRTVRVRGVDAREAVDILAELSWAGATPESFALG